jgi:phosphoenolpyruvate synthase/pyruvate phosphate dikinase
MSTGRDTTDPRAVLLTLDHSACRRAEVAGAKAATPATLRHAGFEVPPGVVIPAGLLAGDDERLPVDVLDELADLPRVLGPGPWAVRSSSAVEDRVEASYAGQFETASTWIWMVSRRGDEVPAVGASGPS